MAIDKQNNRHTTPPQNHIVFIVPRFKGIGSCHKSGTGGNQGRQRTTHHDDRCFNHNNIHSKRNNFSLPVIYFLFHLIIQSSIHLSCPLFVNCHPDLHITQCMSCKILQCPVGLHLIRQIPCHQRPPIMEVAIFMDAWLMCLI